MKKYEKYFNIVQIMKKNIVAPVKPVNPSLLNNP